LRANGSRECAPDDTLREAIHGHKGRVDCFVAPLLAMTTPKHLNQTGDYRLIDVDASVIIEL